MNRVWCYWYYWYCCEQGVMLLVLLVLLCTVNVNQGMHFKVVPH